MSHAKRPAGRAIKVLGLALIVAAFVVGYVARGCGTSQGSFSSPDQTPAAQEGVTDWTCSMHPRIRRPKKGLCPICAMDLIPVTSGGSRDGAPRTITLSARARKLAEIETVPVERKFVAAQIRMVGKIDYDETRIKNITAWVPGRIDRLYVDYTGVPVKKGDQMVSLYSPELLGAQEELIQAIQAVKGLRRSGLDTVRQSAERTVVAASEKLRLFGLGPEQIEEVKTRGKPLDHVTIDAPMGGVVIHKDAVEGMYVKTGTRIYTIADLTRVWVKLDAYESDLMWIRYGQVVTFETEAYPGEVFKGRIVFVDPMLNAKTRSVKVRVNVPNPDGRLRPAMFVRATVRARVAAGGKVMDPALAGKWISPRHPEIIKDSPGTCDLCGIPLVPAESLGYVAADPDKAEAPLVIPTSAPLITGKRAVVYVEHPSKKGTYQGRDIVLGPRAGDYYLVKEGLAEGERVVTNGNFKIDSAVQILAKPSMMSPDPAADLPKRQLLCPVMGNDIDKKIFADHNGKRIYFCCPPCIEKFKKDPDKFVKKLKDQGITLEDAPGARKGKRQKTCPVMGNDIDKKVFADHNGKRIYFCCLPCIEKFKKNPDKFVKKLKDQGIILEDTPRPTTLLAFRKQLDKVLSGYLKVQRALSKDDLGAAGKAAKELKASLGAVDAKALKGQAHMEWMKLAKSLGTIVDTLASAKDIKAARVEFASLSDSLIRAIRTFGSTGSRPTFVAHCPMAFGGRGADWLQDKPEIENPYFGKAMFRCGEVKEHLAGRPPVK